MEAEKAILGRRAVRDYEDKPVPDAVVQKILKAGAMAPSAMDSQPCRFIVITDKKKIKEFSDKVKDKVGILGFGARFAERMKLKEDVIFYGAPLLILIVAEKGSNSGWTKIDCALAAQNMMLRAYDLGLGSCFIGFATLTNNGQENEQDVFVESPATDSIVMVGSTKVSFGTVPANSQVSKTIILGINPSADVGYYSVPLTVQLNTGQSFNTSIGMLVQAASQLSITTETDPTVLIPGSDADLTVKISNIGDSSIRSMQVTLSSDKMTISEGSETFLGTLNVDETNSVIAKVRANAGSGTSGNIITATISFKDSNNQEHQVEKILVLGTSSSALPGAIINSNTSTGLSNEFRTNRTSTGLNLFGVNVGNVLPVLLGAIVLIIVLYFGYRWWTGKGVKK